VRKRAKKKRSMYSVRSPNGRFCKVVPLASAKGPPAQTPLVRVEGVEKGEGRKAAVECLNFVLARVYIHPKLHHLVRVRKHDRFGYEHFCG
jgi:hypothetical protein